jgi:hypothetical protein
MTKEELEFKEHFKKEMNLDENYAKKFGMLKKSCVLFSYGRFVDSFSKVSEAAEMIQKERDLEADKQRRLENKWKFKLGLDPNWDLPVAKEELEFEKIDEKFLEKLDLGVPVQTAKLYIEKTGILNKESYDKNDYLNNQVRDFYLTVEAVIKDKMEDINKMKKKVEKLEENLEAGSMPDAGNLSPKKKRANIYEKKTEMCKDLIEKGKCPYPKYGCPYAHTINQLDLVKMETNIKNLHSVANIAHNKLKKMKPNEPWRPVKAGSIGKQIY